MNENCQYCGKQYDKKGNQKYCSVSCSNKARKQYVQQYNNELKQKRKNKTKNCQYCGKQYKGSGYKYCSDTCKNYAYDEAHNKAQKKYLKAYKKIKHFLGNSIKQHANKNFEREYEIIRKELSRLKIRWNK